MDKVISGIILDWGLILKAYLKSRGFRHLDWWVGITKARGNQGTQVGEDDAVKEVKRLGRMVGEGVRRWVILGSGFHGGGERESHRQRSCAYEEPTNSKTSEVGRWHVTCSSGGWRCVQWKLDAENVRSVSSWRLLDAGRAGMPVSLRMAVRRKLRVTESMSSRLDPASLLDRCLSLHEWFDPCKFPPPPLQPGNNNSRHLLKRCDN